MHATYFIPTEGLDAFIKKVDGLNRKFARAGLPTEFRYSVLKGMERTVAYERFGMSAKVHCALVEIEQIGEELKLNGWSFVAKYEYSPDMPEALAESVPGADVPAEFLAITTTRCDHCRHDRYRKRMYLVANESGELMLVGSACVKAFLGLSESAALLAATWHQALFGIILPAWSEDSEGFRDSVGRPTLDVLAMAKANADVHGWVSRAKANDEYLTSTATLVHEAFDLLRRRKLEGAVQDAYCAALKDEAVLAVIEWLKEQGDPANEYLFKLSKIANAGSVPWRHFNLWVSAVTVLYRREREALQAKEKVEREAKLTVDVVEGRQVIEGRVLSIKEQFSQYGTSWKALIEVANGCRYWGSLPSAYEGGVNDEIRIKATVKPSDRDSHFGFFSRPVLA